jgi:hypothetical protein
VWNLISHIKVGAYIEGFAIRVQRRKLGPEKGEVAGGWRILHNEDFHNLHSSPDIVRMIKSGMIRCTGQVAKWER